MAKQESKDFQEALDRGRDTSLEAFVKKCVDQGRQGRWPKLEKQLRIARSGVEAIFGPAPSEQPWTYRDAVDYVRNNRETILLHTPIAVYNAQSAVKDAISKMGRGFDEADKLGDESVVDDGKQLLHKYLKTGKWGEDAWNAEISTENITASHLIQKIGSIKNLPDKTKDLFAGAIKQAIRDTVDKRLDKLQQAEQAIEKEYLHPLTFSEVDRKKLADFVQTRAQEDAKQLGLYTKFSTVANMQGDTRFEAELKQAAEDIERGHKRSWVGRARSMTLEDMIQPIKAAYQFGPKSPERLTAMLDDLKALAVGLKMQEHERSHLAAR